MQVNPNEAIQVVALNSDTTDANVYYVQAVMRNTLTGAVIATQKLTVDAANSRRFTGQIQAPGYNGASALYIDITVTWYTNNLYTIKATNLPELFTTYQVSYRWSLSMSGGGGSEGFVNFDWQKLQKVLSGHLGATRKYVSDALEGIPGAATAPELDLDVIRETLMGALSEHSTAQQQVAKSIRRKKLQRLLIVADQKKRDDEEAAEAKKHGETEEVLSKILPPFKMAEAKEPAGSLMDYGSERRPSPGIVPLHILERNRRLLKK